MNLFITQTNIVQVNMKWFGVAGSCASTLLIN